MLGADLVSKSAPDGYTLLVGGAPSLVISPAMQAKPAYDGLADFTPICMFVTVPNILVTRPTLAVQSFAELADARRPQVRASCRARTSAPTSTASRPNPKTPSSRVPARNHCLLIPLSNGIEPPNPVRIPVEARLPRRDRRLLRFFVAHVLEARVSQ